MKKVSVATLKKDMDGKNLILKFAQTVQIEGVPQAHEVEATVKALHDMRLSLFWKFEERYAGIFHGRSKDFYREREDGGKSYGEYGNYRYYIEDCIYIVKLTTCSDGVVLMTLLAYQLGHNIEEGE